MATHTTTTRISASATIAGAPDLFADQFTTTSASEAVKHSGTATTTFETIYDASQTTVPPIGDEDPGDQPFLFAIKVSEDDARLRITDALGVETYLRVPEGSTFVLPDGRMGSTNATRIELIEIQAVTDSVDYAYILHHD